MLRLSPHIDPKGSQRLAHLNSNLLDTSMFSGTEESLNGGDLSPRPNLSPRRKLMPAPRTRSHELVQQPTQSPQPSSQQLLPKRPRFDKVPFKLSTEFADPNDSFSEFYSTSLKALPRPVQPLLVNLKRKVSLNREGQGLRLPTAVYRPSRFLQPKPVLRVEKETEALARIETGSVHSNSASDLKTLLNTELKGPLLLDPNMMRKNSTSSVKMPAKPILLRKNTRSPFSIDQASKDFSESATLKPKTFEKKVTFSKNLLVYFFDKHKDQQVPQDHQSDLPPPQKIFIPNPSKKEVYYRRPHRPKLSGVFQTE